MKINSATLDSLRVGFKTSFQNGLDQAESQYQQIATIVPSSTREEKYGWLGKIPNMREWIGERVVQNITEHSYAIPNKDFELTIGVDRNDIEDDNLGSYGMLFEEMGRSTKAHPDQLTFGLLAAGFDTECYDGQYFFDTDHKVLDKNGEAQSVSNSGGGSGTPWFLLDVSRAIKPLIYQNRKSPEFVSKDDPTDDNVFRNKEFLYGVDGRSNVGFGFWQMAYASKQTLDATAYGNARAALMGMKGDYGRPLGLLQGGKKPLLVVPPSLEGVGLDIVNSATGASGATNKWKGTADLLVVPWLA